MFFISFGTVNSLFKKNAETLSKYEVSSSIPTWIPPLVTASRFKMGETDQ